MFPGNLDLATHDGLDRAGADAFERARVQAKHLEARAREAIRKRPLAAVGAAVVAGILVARIGRRRSYPLAAAALAVGTRFVVAAVAERLLAAASSRVQTPR